MKKFIKQLSVASLVAGLALSTGAATFAAEKAFDGQTVKVGVVGDSDKELWEYVAQLAKEKEGIVIEVENLTDYHIPNVAVQDGSLDLNAFQHIIYLEKWNEENKGDIVSIGFTIVEPLGLYSEKVEKLEDLQDGAKIAIPNDATNGGRALLALELAGLIEVDDAKGILPTVKDITKNDKKLEFEEVDAAHTARSLKDVDAAIINGNYAADAGLTVADALFVDVEDKEKLNDAYKNIIATRKADAENPLYKKVVEIYQTEEVAKKIDELTKGTKITAW
ncbi:MAG: MetQ/NlpA family ABC transporter substrate-binding protein [Aerococcaceae bacterium]|nr:MetQ/NlpA family ABC transporter substrate-binding protein [Aerococcaceae bacterium]